MERKVNLLDKIGSLIPGYKGYTEREGRRNIDKLLRSSISNTINNSEQLLNNLMSNSVKEKGVQTLRSLEYFRKRINTLSSKIRYAPYGESGFFDDNRITEQELDHIHELDLSIAEISEDLNKLSQSSSDIILNNMLEKIDLLETKLNKRNNYLANFK